MLHPRAKKMLSSAIPAVFVGIGSAIILLVVVIIANLWQKLLWQTLPPVFGATATTWWWVVAILTLTGVLVGLVATYAPGHAGPDPATVSLFGPPMPLYVLPGLALTLVFALGGGVSLGPENPIIAIIVGVTVACGTRLIPAVPAQGWMMLAAAGTVGAMFGTPVAAALLFSEMMSGDDETPLWDKLFAPLVAAGAGGLTMSMFEQPSFTLAIAPYTEPHLIDIASGMIVAVAAVIVGLIAVWLFPFLHRFFLAFPHPVLMMAFGGFLLGLLGVAGGPITMFKGLAEMKELAASGAQLTVTALVLITAIKIVAVLISATCGFRGGRIFPMVFVGVAFGLLAHGIFPSIPMSLAVASSVLGFTLVVTRDGWLSLFMAAVMIPGSGVALLPLLCIIVLPCWLLLAGKPEMEIKPETPAPAKRTA
jgi:H+/Cl- antiporter ClcA